MNTKERDRTAVELKDETVLATTILKTVRLLTDLNDKFILFENSQARIIAELDQYKGQRETFMEIIRMLNERHDRELERMMKFMKLESNSDKNVKESNGKVEFQHVDGSQGVSGFGLSTSTNAVEDWKPLMQQELQRQQFMNLCAQSRFLFPSPSNANFMNPQISQWNQMNQNLLANQAQVAALQAAQQAALQSTNKPAFGALMQPQANALSGMMVQPDMATSVESLPATNPFPPFNSWKPPPSNIPAQSVVNFSTKECSLPLTRTEITKTSTPLVFSATTASHQLSSLQLPKSSTTVVDKPSKLAFEIANPPKESVSFNLSSVNQTNTTKEGDDDAVEEFEPSVHFEPVISLPEEIDMKTGEEDEEVMFAEHCKLYRHDFPANEWKERGFGVLKILRNFENSTCRIVMRRDQVHKVCANHQITPFMKLTPMTQCTKALVWLAQDYSEGKMSLLKLAARFKTEDVVKGFEEAFEKAQKISGREAKAVVTPAGKIVEVSSDRLVLPHSNDRTSWNCTTCFAPNHDRCSSCACCSSKRTDITSDDVRNTEPSQPNQQSTTHEPPSPRFNFGVVVPSPVFGISDTKSLQQPTFVFSDSVPATADSTKNKFTTFFNQKQPISSIADVPSAFIGSKPQVVVTSHDTTKPTFGHSSLFGQGPVFGGTDKTAKLLFGNSVPTTDSGSAFQGTIGGGFAALASQARRNDSNDENKPPRAVAFSFYVPKLTGSSGPTRNAEVNDGGGAEEFTPTANFAPVIELPSEVEITTGEEDEEVIFSSRCKLYRYVSELNEFRDRGVGDIKILLNPRTSEHRVVMRREQVLKVCLNSRLLRGLRMRKRSSSENTCVWMCRDFSEEAGGLNECFAAKFKEVSVADTFITIFNSITSGKQQRGIECFSSDEGTTENVCDISPSKNDDRCFDERIEQVVLEKLGNYDLYDTVVKVDVNVTMTTARLKSPLKPVEEFEFSGSLSIVQTKSDVLLNTIYLMEGETIHNAHNITAYDEFEKIGNCKMSYLAMEGLKQYEIVVEFENDTDLDNIIAAVQTIKDHVLGI